MHAFQIVGISHEPFERLFDLSDEQLAALGAVRRIVRAYDAQGMMIDAAVCEGSAVQAEIERCFDDRLVAYLQLHNAKRGCFSCQVHRA